MLLTIMRYGWTLTAVLTCVMILWPRSRAALTRKPFAIVMGLVTGACALGLTIMHLVHGVELPIVALASYFYMATIWIALACSGSDEKSP